MPKQKQSKKKLTRLPNINLLVTSTVLILFLGILINQLQQRQTTQSRAAVTNCTVTNEDLALDSEEQNFIKLVNEYRQTKGAKALKVSPNLNRAAAWMSRDMAKNEKMDHTDSLGRDPGDRSTDCGYTGRSGENIAYGYANASGTLKQWQSDVPHDSALKDPDYTVLGIARAKSASGKWYWTYDPGTKDDSGSTVPTEGQVSPTSDVVPSGTCLGACPTTPDQPEEEELPTEEQEEPEEEPEAPTEPTDAISPVPETVSAPNPPSNENSPKKGLLALIFGFFIFLLQLLFGGRPN